jgi:hypothetical protein
VEFVSPKKEEDVEKNTLMERRSRETTVQKLL